MVNIDTDSNQIKFHMPNRVLRDWTDSETIDLLDVNEERFFTRLIMRVDDYGRFSANVKLLKASLFPLKSDVRDTDISRWLTACKKSGLILIYNVANKEYLEIQNFKQILRQKHEKYPSPKKCLADATHMSSECESSVVLKRNELETNPELEDEVETKKSSPTSFEFLNVEDCKTHYLKIQKAAIDQICMAKKIKLESIPIWLDQFNKHLIREGTELKIYRDYVTHFSRWMNKQDTNQKFTNGSNQSNTGERIFDNV
jgi:hypothetical protein